MKVLKFIDRVLTAVVGYAIILFFTIMLVFAAAQVLLRAFFHYGIPWGDIAARHLVIWVGFFGAYLATRDQKHFRIDVVTRFLPLRVRTGLAALTDAFSAAVSILLVQAGLSFLTIALDPDSVSFLGIKSTVVASIVPIGFGFIALQFLLRFIANVVHTVKGTEPETGAAI